jgi:hypothetical protein
MGAAVIACADVARATAKPATAINLIISLPPLSFSENKDGPNLTGLTEQAQTIS